MLIQTKFGLGDRIYGISQFRKEIKVPCETCGGTKYLTGNMGRLVQCPACYGRGYKSDWEPPLYHVLSEELIIGQVCVHETCHQDEPSHEETYMCYSSGIGRGTVWNVTTPVFGTHEGAQAYCDKKNEEEARKVEKKKGKKK